MRVENILKSTLEIRYIGDAMVATNSSDELGFLTQLEIFAGLNPGAFREVLGKAEEKLFSRDEFVFHEGHKASLIHVLVAGQVKIIQITEEGHQIVPRTITAGQMFGGISVMSDVTYPVTAQAMTECRCLTWDGASMKALMLRYPLLTLNALRYVQGQLRQVQERYRELATERVEQRVARALLRLVRQAGRRTDGGFLIDIPLTREDLAEMTGTTLYTVSRVLTDFEKRGLISSQRQSVCVLTHDGMAAVAKDDDPTCVDH